MLLIKNGKIMTMTGGNIEKGSILIKYGKIENIGIDIEIPQKCEVINVNGAWVLPGLIDAHCHIGILEETIGFEGRDLNEATDPITPQLRAIDGINPMDPAFKEAVKAGITSVMTGPGSTNVIGGQFLVMKTNSICVDDGVIFNNAAVKIAFGENPKSIYHGKNKMPMTRMGIAGLLRETLVSAINYMHEKEDATAKSQYFSINLKMEALIPVLKREIPLKAHAHRADDILTAIRIAKEFDLKLTIDHCTEGNLIVNYIKNSGFPAIIGPNLTSRSKIETKNKSFKTAGILNSAGIKIALMTDHPVIPINYLAICAGLAVKDGLDFDEALKAITIYPAQIIGVSKRVGSIEIGKDADIAIFDGNPMEVLTNTLFTIIDGNIIYRK